MPTYDYKCKECGTYELRAGLEDSVVVCKTCKGTAERVQVYRQNFVMSPALPTTQVEAQGMLDKEMRKIGWTGDRAVEELRGAFQYDEEGRGELDVGKMSKTASKRGTDVD